MVIQTGVLCMWTNDSQCFLLEHFDTIYNSPSHIYHAPLLLLPSSSWLSKWYNAELSLQARVVKGLPAEWGVCSRTLSLNNIPWALSSWKNTIVVGLWHKDIIIFDRVTGSQVATLSGHAGAVQSLTFSSDGTSLVSGGGDHTVKLWDVQTGGVAKTFFGHTRTIWSVSITADYTRIASGSGDYTIRLWDIGTGRCYHIIKQQGYVGSVHFSPIDSQYLLFVSNNKVWQWDINGHQIPLTYDGSYVTFSPNGTEFALCNGTVITVQNSDSKATVAKFHVPEGTTRCCCFSPDGRLVAIAVGNTVYIWDITSSDPYLVETFIGHTNDITSLEFSSPSSLISASYDQSVKFWQIGTLSPDPVMTDLKSTTHTPAPIKSISLQAKDGIFITSDSEGVVRTWDISTSLCKKSFQTQAKTFHNGDVQLIGNRLFFAWYIGFKIYVQDVEKGELIWAADISDHVDDIKISRDGSKVFCLDTSFIQAWSLQTGEVVGKVKVEETGYLGTLVVDGSRVWLHYPESKYQGWDFGTPGSSPIQLPNTPTLHLNGPMAMTISWSKIKDAVTGKVIFQLSGRFADPVDVQCDGCYLAARYYSGEVLILDFNYVFPQ